LDDPDDAPELTEEWFVSADFYHGERLVRPGRTTGSASSKEAVSIRLDAEVLAYFRATGPGWQSRINAALRRAAGLPS
jgi:uncharacterized protein (DUF4415 family)